MTPLDLHSERFPPTGALTARGALNALGRPDLDVVSLLIREMGQNSWDARAGTHPVSFAVDVWRADALTVKALREVYFPKTPDKLPLRQVLTSAGPAHPLWLMSISDRKTVGLGGPTRADRPAGSNGANNFVEYLRNFGHADNAAGSGGTYGYGKTAAYLSGAARTILAYTRWKVSATRYESRFIASALGDLHGLNTGRHWWGRMEDNIAEPLLDSEADEAAAGLGLSVMSGSETGTTIVVIQPTFTDDGVEAAVRSIPGVIAWHFWPKMLVVDARPPDMTFTVSLNGDTLEVPDPRQTPALAPFVQAFDLTVSLSTGVPAGIARRTTIKNERPIRDLGTLTIVKVPKQPDAPELPGRPFEGAARHIALMRQPNLVVKYLEAAPLPSGLFEYGGVFKVDPAVEELFRASEPPTHDDWHARMLGNRTDRSAINVAMRKVAAEAESFAAPLISQPTAAASTPLGSFSRSLGSLLPGAEGDGTSPTERRPGSGPGVRRARVKITGHAPLPPFNGEPAVGVSFQVTAKPSSTATRVSARVGAALDDGSIESEPPDNAATPRLLGWMDPQGRVVRQEVITIPARDTADWIAVVSLVPDTSSGIDLTAEAVE